jgi:hypothetical protein
MTHYLIDSFDVYRRYCSVKLRLTDAPRGKEAGGPLLFRSATPQSSCPDHQRCCAATNFVRQVVCEESTAAIAARSAERRGSRPPAPPALHPSCEA